MTIALLIPCYNEEKTVGKVIDDFKQQLPNVDIYVYDNNSSDLTAEVASEHGAIVRKEYRQGKGNVVRSMFQDIDADYYIMVDGDDTYPAERVKDLLVPLQNGTADMTIGDRLSNGTYSEENKRKFHGFGNDIVRWSINKLFKSNINDIMTGYRGFNRYFVKNFPVLSNGFQIETELSIHCVENNFLIKEIPIEYRDRPEGSFSKLNTFKDGFKVINMIFKMLKDVKPFLFFGILSAALLTLGLFLGVPVINDFIKTGMVPRLPTAILSASLITISVLSFFTGTVLDTINTNHKKNYFLTLLRYKENSR